MKFVKLIFFFVGVVHSTPVQIDYDYSIYKNGGFEDFYSTTSKNLIEVEFCENFCDRVNLDYESSNCRLKLQVFYNADANKTNVDVENRLKEWQEVEIRDVDFKNLKVSKFRPYCVRKRPFVWPSLATIGAAILCTLYCILLKEGGSILKGFGLVVVLVVVFCCISFAAY